MGPQRPLELSTMPQLHHFTIDGGDGENDCENEFPPQFACELLEKTSAESVALVGVQLYGASAPRAESTRHRSGLKSDLRSKRILYLRTD